MTYLELYNNKIDNNLLHRKIRIWLVMFYSKFYKWTFISYIMQLQILKQEKNEIELEIGSVTIAELLRAYINEEDGVVLSAWRREHPTKNPHLKIKTKDKSAKKVFSDAIAAIEKDLDKLEADFKKAK